MSDSGNRSRKLTGGRKVDGVVEGVGDHCHHGLGKQEGTGRILETVGSPGDFKTQSAVCLIRHYIDAIASLGELDIQQTAILEAKDAGAGRFQEIEIIWARASAG